MLTQCSQNLARENFEEITVELQENADAIESIILCASHQGRIADDILSVSKLQMGLLSISPVPFKVTAKVGETIRMFDLECQQKGIKLSINKDKSISELNAEWVVADPSRLAQVLLNFLSNAIKYTSQAKVRNVTIHLQAFGHPPPPQPAIMRVCVSCSPCCLCCQTDDLSSSWNETLEPPPDCVWLSIGVQEYVSGRRSAELG